jgi:hypothetical protein
MTVPKLSATTMGADIVTALNALIPPAAGEDPVARERVGLAIARGVLKHINDQAGALHVNVKDAGPGTLDRSVTVEVDTGTL